MMESRSAVDRVTSTTSLFVLLAVLVVKVKDLVDGAASCSVSPVTDRVEALTVSLNESCTVPAFMLRSNDCSDGGVVSGVYDAAFTALAVLTEATGFELTSLTAPASTLRYVLPLEIARVPTALTALESASNRSTLTTVCRADDDATTVKDPSVTETTELLDVDWIVNDCGLKLETFIGSENVNDNDGLPFMLKVNEVRVGSVASAVYILASIPLERGTAEIPLPLMS